MELSATPTFSILVIVSALLMVKSDCCANRTVSFPFPPSSLANCLVWESSSAPVTLFTLNVSLPSPVLNNSPFEPSASVTVLPVPSGFLPNNSTVLLISPLLVKFNALLSAPCFRANLVSSFSAVKVSLLNVPESNFPSLVKFFTLLFSETIGFELADCNRPLCFTFSEVPSTINAEFPLASITFTLALVTTSLVL